MQSFWPLPSVLQHYNLAVRKHPLKTQAVTTGALWCLGDAIAQRLELQQQRRLQRSGHHYDIRRALLSTAFGAAAVGPLSHLFYHGLDQVAGMLYRPGSLQFIAFKVLVDSLIYEPLYVLGSFALMTLGSGGSMADLACKVRQDYWATLGLELAVWPAIQAVNFKFIPTPDLQVLVVNLITVLDSAFISHVAVQPAGAKPLPPPPRPEQAGISACPALPVASSALQGSTDALRRV